MTFEDVSSRWLKHTNANGINLGLLLSRIGDENIVSLSSEKLTNCLIDLYDNERLRGVVFASYRKSLGDILQFAFDQGYISEIPKIEQRSASVPNRYNRPDNSAMQLLLSHENGTPAGTALRLAWCCGLLRRELTFLLWKQVDFKEKRLSLPDRNIPLNDEMVSYLIKIYKCDSPYSDYVLLSQRKTAPMAEQSVSALVRRALDSCGQNNVRLNDLRIDFIVRALKKHNMEYVSYISGVDIPALLQHYQPYADDEVDRSGEKTEITQSVHTALESFLQKESTSMVGLSVSFAWLMGIPVQMIPNITWRVIDFEKSKAVFEDRRIDIPNNFLQLLLSVKSLQEDGCSNIVLNDTKKNPTDAFFIQKAVQQALVSSGIIGITLPDLVNDYWRSHLSELRKTMQNETQISAEFYSMPRGLPAGIFTLPENELIDYLQESVSASKKTLKNVLGISERELSLLLAKCLNSGKIIRMGPMYYLPNAIVRREEQKDVILKYVAQHQQVTSSELTALLKFRERRQIYWVINPLLESGELIKMGRNKYCLPELEPGVVMA